MSLQNFHNHRLTHRSCRIRKYKSESHCFGRQSVQTSGASRSAKTFLLHANFRPQIWFFVGKICESNFKGERGVLWSDGLLSVKLRNSRGRHDHRFLGSFVCTIVLHRQTTEWKYANQSQQVHD